MKTEPLKDWLFNPACSNCVQNFHKTQKAVAWFDDKLVELANKSKGILKAADVFKLKDEAFIGVEGK